MSKKLTLSFEFFPPKTAEGLKHLHQAAQELAELQPDFMSVTFGAGGSTRQGTLETIHMLQKLNINAAPHLSCIGCSKEQLKEILTIYQTMGIKRIVALRGDLPSGMGNAGELRYASELVELIRKQTGNSFRIEVAAYPEFHPQAKNAHEDLINFKKKVEAGANSAITQYFYNPDAYFYFLDQCAKQAINIPIVPGIMPITQFTKLVRFSEMCGAEIPRWIYKRLESYGDDHDSIRQFGREVVFNLCERLLRGGAPGLHFYTLNHAEVSIELVRLLGVKKEKENVM